MLRRTAVLKSDHDDSLFSSVHDHPVVRHGINDFFSLHGLKGAVIGEAGDASAALRQVAEGGLDVIIADISLPEWRSISIKDLQWLHR